MMALPLPIKYRLKHQLVRIDAFIVNDMHFCYANTPAMINDFG